MVLDRRMNCIPQTQPSLRSGGPGFLCSQRFIEWGAEDHFSDEDPANHGTTESPNHPFFASGRAISCQLTTAEVQGGNHGPESRHRNISAGKLTCLMKLRGLRATG